MAHARCKFVDALSNARAKATEVLERMGQLYTIEQDKGFTWEQRTAERQLKSVTVLDDILKWLQDHANTVMPIRPNGQSIAHTFPRCGGLSATASTNDSGPPMSSPVPNPSTTRYFISSYLTTGLNT